MFHPQRPTTSTAIPAAGSARRSNDDGDDDGELSLSPFDVRNNNHGNSSSTAAAAIVVDRGEEDGKKKRPRTAFTAAQIKALESEFEKCKYLSVTKRVELSRKLGLTQQQLKVWYQNRRTKWKRKYAQDVESVAKQYYSSLGLNTSLRPMFIGDRLWLFNYLTGMPVAGVPPLTPLSSQDDEHNNNLVIPLETTTEAQRDEETAAESVQCPGAAPRVAATPPSVRTRAATSNLNEIPNFLPASSQTSTNKPHGPSIIYKPTAVKIPAAAAGTKTGDRLFSTTTTPCCSNTDTNRCQNSRTATTTGFQPPHNKQPQHPTNCYGCAVAPKLNDTTDLCSNTNSSANTHCFLPTNSSNSSNFLTSSKTILCVVGGNDHASHSLSESVRTTATAATSAMSTAHAAPFSQTTHSSFGAGMAAMQAMLAAIVRAGNTSQQQPS